MESLHGLGRGENFLSNMLAIARGVSAGLFLLLAVALPAQSLDPRLVQSLQGQLGAAQGGLPSTQTTTQPAAQGVAGDVFSAQATRVDTAEEQQVRRAQARLDLAELYQPSPIEQDYRQRLQDSNLRQFGYDYFQSAPSPTGVRTGAIGDDYVLGIGDELQISFRGATNSSQTVRVERDGRIAVGQLRPIQAAGRTVGGVRAELAAETRRTLLATNVYISVGDVRAISVFVGGEVERPGQFSMTSLADIGTAIAQAGGIRRSGSLRQVRVVRSGGGTVTVDLYGLLGIGAPSSIRLRDGDRVIVPVIGPTVAVTGAVARPGIYELRGGASVGAVVSFAGGPIRQRGAQIVISRIAADGTETFVRAASQSSNVLGGDAVQLVGGSAGGASGRVSLAGHVDNPGARPLVAAGTIAELVGAPEDLRPDSYQLAAVLVRRDASTGARVFTTVNLSRELRERPSMRLQSEDRLFIFSRRDIEFMNSAPVRQVVLGQNNVLPQCKSLNRLVSLVRDTEAARFNAVTRGGFVVVTSSGAEIGTIGGALGQGGARGVEQLVRRDADDRDPQCPQVFEDEPELLAILIESSVSVGGSVRRPGAYPVAGRVSARDLSLVADGMLSGNRDLILDINRAAFGSSERVQADESGSVLALTSIGPGDDIRFNAQQPIFEGSGVLLTGEVARPGLYAIRKGESLLQLLTRAGGLSDYAYPYGTVFTRRSVKDSQEEGYRRTARELNNSLLAIAARSTETSSDGLAGAAALIQTLAGAEAPGRVVVEADPRVLAVRPDLDTILEPGDAIFVPKRPNFVLTLGDVNNPSALQFVEGKPSASYLREAGGTLSTADRDRIFMVLPNGTAQPLRTGGWSGSSSAPPPPGTTIIVPKNIDPLFRLSVIRDISTIIAQLATSVATVAILATN